MELGNFCSYKKVLQQIREKPQILLVRRCLAMGPPRRRRVPPLKGSRSRCLPRLERRWGRVSRRGTCKIKGERKLIRPFDKSAISSHIARRREKKKIRKIEISPLSNFFFRDRIAISTFCAKLISPPRKRETGKGISLMSPAKREEIGAVTFFSGETNQLIPFDLSHTLVHSYLVCTFSTIEAYSQSLSFAEV